MARGIVAGVAGLGARGVRGEHLEATRFAAAVPEVDAPQRLGGGLVHEGAVREPRRHGRVAQTAEGAAVRALYLALQRLAEA